MAIKNITLLTLSSIAGEEVVPLVGAAPYFDYVNNVKSSVSAGIRYAIIMPQNGYEQLSVKVEGTTLPITQEDIDAIKPQLFLVSFTDFSAKVYTDKATVTSQLSAKSDNMVIVGKCELVTVKEGKA